MMVDLEPQGHERVIWWISKYARVPDLNEPPGRHFGLARELTGSGCHTVLITSDSQGDDKTPKGNVVYDFSTQKGVSVTVIRTFKYTKALSIRRVLSWVDFELKLLFLPSRKLPRPDAVVVSSLSLLTILNGLRLKRRFDCRLVFDVRDIWPLVLIEEGGFSPHNPLVRVLAAIERVGYVRSDVVTGTMPNLTEHVRNVTRREITAHCIPHGVDLISTENSEPLEPQFVSNFMPDGKFLIGYAGSLSTANAMDVFFYCAELMAHHSSIHFVVVGDGDLREDFIERYGHLPNVTIGPKIRKAQVQDFLSRCDLLYFSIRNVDMYRFGRSLNKTIDYMLAAKPIVASYSGYPMTISEAQCGSFVPAGDVTALRKEIIRYQRLSKKSREEMGLRGREWLVENRNYSKLASDLLGVLFPNGAEKA